ncbi:MAG TPA: hypothetical protein VLT59_02120 [Steroidobacteraceae bacterium]|nr:hypothetical protein [Steroidobacteraceae bacterium]
MRVLGTFVNFGNASEHGYWQGHVMRTAWRERRRVEAANARARAATPAARGRATHPRAPSAAPCAR